MKKVSLVLIIIFCLATFMMPVSAATASASITGPSAVRAGDDITVAVNFNGTGLMAAQGNVLYDASKLEYKSFGGKLSGWSVDLNASSGNLAFLAVDDTLTNPISSSKKLFSITFKVIGSLAAGTAISVTGSNFKVSDGTSDFAPSTSDYSVTLAAAASTNADLESLSVAEGSISPAFAKATTSYALSVPFTTAKVTVTAKAADADAKVKISSPELTAGGTTSVTVKVTAASGATKTYTIKVSRGNDPNYVPGANNSLTSITLSAGLISPAFSKDVNEYIVYLPYEIDQISATATPEDSKTTVAVEGGTALQVDQNNLMKISCTAEDGTVKTYTVVVIRTAAFSGLASLVTPTPAPTETTVKPTTTAATTTQATTAATQTTDTTENGQNTPNSPISTGLLIFIIVLAILVVAELGYIIYLKKLYM